MICEESQSQKTVLRHRRNEHCWPCRLVSGIGIIGIGAYIYSQAKHRPVGIGRDLIIAISAGTAILGTARLVGVYPFNNKNT